MQCPLGGHFGEGDFGLSHPKVTWGVSSSTLYLYRPWLGDVCPDGQRGHRQGSHGWFRVGGDI